MMAEIYFVRHGESEWNVLDRICGSTDIALTDRGRQQATEAAEEILRRGIHAKIILHSPLKRAAETAKIISIKTGIPLCSEERLTEQNFGRWEGTSPRNSASFCLEKQQFVNSFCGGESMLRVAQRVYNLLDEVTALPDPVILVAHNGIARVVRSYFTDMTNEEYAVYGVKNCSVTRFPQTEKLTED